MLYVGNPLGANDQSAFSSYSIAAAVAYEYQHLVRFSRKTYLPVLSGEAGAPQEDNAFDEGMAHLTENLLGLGYSGGNALFIREYLESPVDYSVCGPDPEGVSDSIGRRGGAVLFLSWLVEGLGGIGWEPDNPTAITAESGPAVSFLRHTLKNGMNGWDLIEDYWGARA